jgi:hypothetical protein
VKKPSPWSPETLFVLHQEYLAGKRPSDLASRRHRTSAELLAAFDKAGLKLRPQVQTKSLPKRIADEIVHELHRQYVAGASLKKVATRSGRSASSLRELFESRGLAVRPPCSIPPQRREDGSFAPRLPATDEEIADEILKATKIMIPERLRLDWRTWSMPRKEAFVLALFKRLKSPDDRPDLPFSSNVIPFHYGTPEAMEIMARRNLGKDSQSYDTKLNLNTQGVIWDGQLWFWCRKSRCYAEAVQWSKECCRPILSRVIYERFHGPIPPQGVVRMIDRNPNNLDPSNLMLSSMNEVCRENQAAVLTRKAREKTAQILKRHTTPTNDNTRTDISALKRRHRGS